MQQPNARRASTLCAVQLIHKMLFHTNLISPFKIHCSKHWHDFDNHWENAVHQCQWENYAEKIKHKKNRER